MIPRLGQRFSIDIETIQKTREEYGGKRYADTGLPHAPAIMVDNEVVVQGRDITEEELEAIISGKLEKRSDP
ncbi:MAG: thioredoxin family protein [Deltaproteobacteria bacterium]|nr:thioredoxin family protein [Deltaproteobacteria bacterium]